MAAFETKGTHVLIQCVTSILNKDWLRTSPASILYIQPRVIMGYIYIYPTNRPCIFSVNPSCSAPPYVCKVQSFRHSPNACVYKSSFASWFWLVLSCLSIGVRCQGVLRFDLCYIPFLILLCEFNTEHAGPSWQKPDQVNCWAVETKERSRWRLKGSRRRGLTRDRQPSSYWLSRQRTWSVTGVYTVIVCVGLF